jgi:hypothetical protein
MGEDALLSAFLGALGLSTALSLGVVVRSRRRPAPAEDEPATALLGVTQVPQAAIPVLGFVLGGMALSLGIAIAGKELADGTWIADATLVLRGLLLPATTLAPAIVVSERVVRANAKGRFTVDGTVATVSWGEEKRRFSLPSTTVQLGWAPPLDGNAMGALVVRLDDGSVSPAGRGGPTRVLVPVTLSMHRWLQSLDLPDVGWTDRTEGVPVLSADAEARAVVDRVVARARRVNRLREPGA